MGKWIKREDRDGGVAAGWVPSFPVSVTLAALLVRKAMSEKRRDPRPYVGMHKEVIFGCPEWAALSSQARSLYFLLKGKRNPKKNHGFVQLSYRALKKIGYRGLKRPATVAKIYRELESGGWIRRRDEGGGLFGKASVYELTGKFDEYGFRKDER